MNKRQAARIALAVRGTELVLGETPTCISEHLSDKDEERVHAALLELGRSMLKRAGFDDIPSPEEILSTVLGDEYQR